MTTDLDTVIADVELILRLRSAVRVARETLTRTTLDLTSVLADLKKRETALAEAIGASPASTWHDATLKESKGWTIEDKAPSKDKRQRFERIRKDDVVWMSHHRALGTVRKIDRYGVHEIERIPDGKVFHYKTRHLWRPLPDEALDAIECAGSPSN